VDLKRTLGAAAALLLAGCEVYAEPSPIPCPGTREGVFQFQGAIIAPAGCTWAASQYQTAFSFPGSISFDEGTSNKAWLCVDVPHAVPREGTHTPVVGMPNLDTIDVKYQTPIGVGNCTCPSEAARDAGRCSCPPTSPLSNCNCPVTLTETITGTLERLVGGSVFSGVQTVVVEPPLTALAPSDLCECQKRCSFQYTVKADPL
jgi:hypothetical protein